MHQSLCANTPAIWTTLYTEGACGMLNQALGQDWMLRTHLLDTARKARKAGQLTCAATALHEVGVHN